MDIQSVFKSFTAKAKSIFAVEKQVDLLSQNSEDFVKEYDLTDYSFY